MGLLDVVISRFRSEANPPAIIHVDPDRVHGGYNVSPFRVQSDYLRVWASDMLLRYDRIGPIDVTPGVQSLVVLNFGNQTQEIPGLVGPARIAKVEAKGRQAVRVEHQLLTPLLPYRGGTVQLESALLRLPGENHFQAFTNVLGKMTDMLALGEVSSALNVANGLADGIADLFGLAGPGKLMLGWMSTFGDVGVNALRSGYVLVAPPDTVDPRNIVVDRGLLYQYIGHDLVRVDDQDYLLLEIERVETRNDWESLTSIERPLARAQEALDLGEPTDAAAFFRAAIIAIRQTNDLSRSDKELRIASIRQRMAPLETAVARDQRAVDLADESAVDPYSPDAVDD